MTVKEFKSLFPLKAMITQEIIDKADREALTYCVGALTLQSVLPQHPRHDIGCTWTWFNWSSDQFINGIKVVVGTKEAVRMMTVKEPQEVTFIILD